MMNTKYSLTAITPGQTQQSYVLTTDPAGKGKTLTLNAAAGARYQLTDLITLISPDKLRLKRSAQDLQIALPGSVAAAPDVIIKNYYNFDNVSFSGMAASGESVAYDTGWHLSTGQPFTGVQPDTLGPSKYISSALESSPGWLGNGWTWLALGGLAAASAGSRSSSSASSSSAASLTKITTYKDTTKPLPEVMDFSAVGVTGVDASNIDGIRSLFANNQMPLNTAANIQLLVDSYNKILAEANGTSPDPDPGSDPSVSDYSHVLGSKVPKSIDGIGSKPEALSLLNDMVKGLFVSDVALQSQIQTLALAVEALSQLAQNIASANGATASVGNITVAQLLSLGVDTSAAVAANLASYSDAIRASADDLSSLNTTAKIKALVTAYNTILAEANGSTIDTTVANPSAVDYAAVGADIGTAKTDADALKRLNAIVGNLANTAVDTVGEINKLAATLDKIQAVAALDTGATLSDAQKFSVDELKNLGLTGFSSSDANNTVLALAVSNAIRDQAAVDVLAGTATGTKWVDGVKTPVDQTQLERLQALVSLEIIKNHVVDAADSSKTTPTPTLADWKAAGIFKPHATLAGKYADLVDADLVYLNSAVDKVQAVDVDSTAKLQAVADAYFKIIKEANGSGVDADTSSNPTATDYARTGITGKTVTPSDPQHVNALKMLNDGVSVRSLADVDTVKEIQTLADLVDKTYTLAALDTGVTLTEAQKFTAAELTSLSMMGLTFSTAQNDYLAKTVSEAIRDGDPATLLTGQAQKLVDGVKTPVDQTQLERLQALVSLEIIKNHVVDAADSSKTTPTPTLADWKAAGIFKPHATLAGKYADLVDADLVYLNSAVDKVQAVDVDSTAKLQAVADAYFKIIKEANGSGVDASIDNPTLDDFAKVGLTGLAVEQVSLLTTLIGEKSSNQVDTVAKLQGLLLLVNDVLTLADKASISAVSSLDTADVSNLSVSKLSSDWALSGVNDKNQGDVLMAIQNADKAGVDTFAELQGLVSLTRIMRYADDSNASSNAGGEPTWMDWKSIVGLGNESEANLKAYNSAVDSYTADGLKTLGSGGALAGLQKIADAYNGILAEADGNKSVDQTAYDPSLADYQNLNLNFSASWSGLTVGGVAESNTHALTLLTNAVGGLSSDKVDTFTELEALSGAVGRVILQAQLANTAITNTTGNPTNTITNTAGPTKADLTLLGLDTSKIANSPNSTDSYEFTNILAEIQNLDPVNAVDLFTLQNKINAWALF